MSRAGDKTFDRCDVKVVEFIDSVFTEPTEVHRGSHIVPLSGLGTVDKEIVEDDSGQFKQYAGSGAKLHCPRTQDDRLNVESAVGNHDGRIRALQSLRALAGELLCSTCRYSSMSPVDVALEQAKLANAEAGRLQGLALRAKAIAELNEANPGFDYHER